ncbi:MAG: response regulator transcription factor [Candidatus Obscuribacterales bacterium]|nr:response regulator transcription factor [Candidatus Obscuribacterales bacterium]
MAKILLVEDDKNLARLLMMQLEHDRHLVDVVAQGEEALAALKIHEYDLIILDWMLPDVTGVDICKLYRQRGGTSPILMLTAKETAEDKVAGLDAGADDYLTKPFNPPELSARIRALLRRPAAIAGKALKVKDLVLDTITRRVTRSEQTIDLTAKEFRLLELLMKHPNQSFTVESILDRLWHADANASMETVRTHIKTLRRKIGDSEENPIIRSRRGLGYKIVGD